MKTTVTKSKTITRQWHHIDLDGQTLGRVSTEIATLIIGKNKPYFTGNLDCGDYVVVTNAAKVHVTGKKKTDKLYRHHTNYPGGFRETNFQELMRKDPAKVITHSVKGMLPKNKLQAKRLKRLKIFADDNHTYADKLSQDKE